MIVLYTAGLCGDNVPMIQKVFRIRPLGDPSAEREDMEYWLSRPPGERMEELENLRRHFYGDLPRIQKVARVIKLKQG